MVNNGLRHKDEVSCGIVLDTSIKGKEWTKKLILEDAIRIVYI